MNTKILARIIVIIALVLAVGSVWNDSPVVDEIPHIGAGYSYIQKGDYRLNPEHPPLAKDLAGLSMSILHLKQTAFDTQFWKTDINGQWNFGRNLLFNSDNDAVLAVRMAKMPELIFFILSAIIIFAWAKKLYGEKAALLALFLFSFSPTVIAHSRLVTTDVPVLFGVLLGSFFFIKFLKDQSHKNFWFATVAFGIAQLTKFSAVLLAPLFIILAIFYAFENRKLLRNLGLTILMMAAGILLVVWPVYYLHTMNYPPEKQKSDTVYYLGSYGNRLFADPVVQLADKPVIRALDHYVTGVLMVNQRAIGGNDTYFLGEVSNHAWKKYFPIVYFIKEPLPFWGFVLLTLIAVALQIRLKRALKFSAWENWIKEHFTEFAMLLWIAFYWFMSIRANLNIGVRHLMPTYGFVFILVSGQVIWMLSKYEHKKKIKNILIGIVAVLIGWYAYENFSVYPYYLTYFNEVVGGPSGGHNIVVDSNLDWGQDLNRLSQYVYANNIPRIEFDYFGWADPAYYLKDRVVWLNAGKYKDLNDYLRKNPKGGYLAVSATFYMGSLVNPNSYDWLKEVPMLTTIGNSIYVWHITP